MLFCIFLEKKSEEALLKGTVEKSQTIANCGRILSKSRSLTSIYLLEGSEEQLGCLAEGAFKQSTNPFNRLLPGTN